MVKIRYVEESFIEPIAKGLIRCPVHLYTGQEAIATGLGASLSKEDYIFGNHRSHGHYIAKGGDITELIAEVYCRKDGCSRGRGGSMHIISPENGVMGIVPIVAGTISLATGAALSSKIRNDKRVTVSFFGDGATGEGVLYESMNFASLKKLPIIFVCENNLYSTHLPIDEIRTNRRIYEIAGPLGIKAERVNGNDVIEVYRKAQLAVEYCREGNGPYFIEYLTYRQRGHVGPDDNVQGTHTDIRPKNEIEEWLLNDPIIKMENIMIKEGGFTEYEISEMKKSIVNEINHFTDIALKSPKPPAEDSKMYLFYENEN
ncbi:MAG: thiamine pyrophosphate-dependent dehydrogenase E1 component subunit alpha [Bacteroidota bacterium]|nr:thiamine pyrophosphate-dependent dehydrogenase E1 component subunit alpha [Bacteroidota bacterium]